MKIGTRVIFRWFGKTCAGVVVGNRCPKTIMVSVDHIGGKEAAYGLRVRRFVHKTLTVNPINREYLNPDPFFSARMDLGI